MSAFPGGRRADAHRSGIGWRRLRTAYDRLAYDLNVPAGSVTSLLQRCAALQQVLPATAVFCLWTAALLLELPLPLGFDERLHVAVPAGQAVPQRPQLVAHSLILPNSHVTRVGPLTVTTPFVDLATVLHEPALIALGDAALNKRKLSAAELEGLLSGAGRRRGVVRARRAAARLDGRAESPPESLVRTWVQDAGLPDVTQQAVIRDRDGEFVARVDLLIAAFRIVIEYEGSHHRNREQFGEDLDRRNRLQSLDYLVVHIDATTLDRASAVRIVTEALRVRGWQPSPSR